MEMEALFAFYLLLLAASCYARTSLLLALLLPLLLLLLPAASCQLPPPPLPSPPSSSTPPRDTGRKTQEHLDPRCIADDMALDRSIWPNRSPCAIPTHCATCFYCPFSTGNWSPLLP
jgi:hypothetical protein